MPFLEERSTIVEARRYACVECHAAYRALRSGSSSRSLGHHPAVDQRREGNQPVMTAFEFFVTEQYRQKRPFFS